MTYQALARKWRPSNFSELVGQEHVTRSLLHALQHNRLHHAYLFTGTRGVGKTTVARILAKSINCKAPVAGEPCGQCDVCQAFEQARFLDLIEIDAASRTGVEDTRELLDNVQYAPHQGSYKVYLIDEVHMLSGHSFNALLKTLEEPPPHVKFLLATTDPQKIPITVLSRCLQFNLKRLLPDQIDSQMQYILQQENISYETGAISTLARAADGSLRDGLSLLDQAIAFGGGKVVYEDVINMLGSVGHQTIETIVLALADFDGKKVLETIAETASLTPDFTDLLQQVVRVMHRVALMQQFPHLKDAEFDLQFLQTLAEKLMPEDVQLFYQIALQGQKDLEWAPDPRSGFEMIMLRMLTFRPKRLSSEISSEPKKPVEVSAVAVNEKKKAQTVENDDKPQTLSTPEHDWHTIVAKLKIRGLTLQLANNCVLQNVDNHNCQLIIDPVNQHLLSSKTQANLQQAVETYFGKPIKLRISVQKNDNETPAVAQRKDQAERQQAAIDAVNADENIQALKDRFGARVLPGSIKPNDE